MRELVLEARARARVESGERHDMVSAKNLAYNTYGRLSWLMLPK